ncbi:MAG: UvrD-helicase domain-containing protein [Ilumatobacteraceae bacterium]
MDADALLHGLDARQREAVTSTAAPLAIIAAAGSGKTTVLTRRIAHRIATGTATAGHTLALTFTRDAAGELRRRLTALDLRQPIESGTFHSVALRLLRDRALARHETPPRVAVDRLRLVRECLTELRLDASPSAAISDIDWARARLVPPERYEELSRRARRSAVPPSRFADLARAYERLKRRRGVVDFDDLLERALQAVRGDAVFAEVVRWRFRHLYVDEAQDLNPLQHELLESWRGGRADLCLVGDPRQAIYGWNGAESTALTEVERYYPGVTVVALTTNHRCSPQVVRAGAAALAGGGHGDDTTSDRPDGPAVEIRGFASEHDEADAVTRLVLDALGRHHPGDVGVLARTNDQLAAIERRLESAGVPTVRAAGRSPLDVALADAYRAGNRDQLTAWADTALADPDDVRRRVAEEADRYLVASEPGGFRAWVESRRPFDDLVAPPADAVAMLTFHAAKGREWETVVVTGVEDGLVPHGSATNAAQRAEESRLLYVALTRARRQLTITHAEQRNGRPASPSPWLDAVRDAGSVDAPTAPPPTLGVRRAVEDPLAGLREWRRRVARVAGVPEVAVCNERVLRSLHDDPPTDVAALAERLGMSITAAARLRPLPATGDVSPPPARPSSDRTPLAGWR